MTTGDADEERALRWSSSRGEVVECPIVEKINLIKADKLQQQVPDKGLAAELRERLRGLEEWANGELLKLEAALASARAENAHLKVIAEEKQSDASSPSSSQPSFKERAENTRPTPKALEGIVEARSTATPKAGRRKSRSIIGFGSPRGSPRSRSSQISPETQSLGEQSPRSVSRSPRDRSQLAVSFHSDFIPPDVPEDAKDPPEKPAPVMDTTPSGGRVRLSSGWGRLNGARVSSTLTAWDIPGSDRSECDTASIGPESASPYTPLEGGNNRHTRVNSRRLTLRAIYEVGVDPDVVPQITSGVSIINIRKGSVATTSSFQTRGTTTILAQASRMTDFVEQSIVGSVASRCIIQPSAKRRIAWDLLCFLMVSYDIIMIPLLLFDLPASEYAKAMVLCSAIFWTLDILLSFAVGYHLGGTIEMRPSKIAQHYLRTFFALDVALAALDWVSVVVSLDEDAWTLFALKLPRLLRAMKVSRLLRLMKVAALVEQSRFFIHSEILMTVMKVLKFLVSITIVNHFVACAWYAVGKFSRHRDIATWVNELEATSSAPVEWHYYYTTALHWSLTQFTPASMEVVPHNTFERIFTVLVIIVALILFSSFLSTITQAMTQLRQMREEKMRQQELVWRYMNENNVSIELANSIHSFISKYSSIVKKRIHQKDIMILRAMPETIRLQLDYEVFFPVLTRHPFFERCVDLSETGVMNLCHFSMKEFSLMVGQELFLYSEKAEQMYFLVSGQLKYHYKGAVTGTSVMRGDHVCEMAVWVMWTHRGNLVSSTPSELMTLDANHVQSVFSQLPLLLRSAQEYARAYVTLLKEAQDTGSHLSDLWKDMRKQADIAVDAFAKPANRRGSLSTCASEASHFFARQATWDSNARSMGLWGRWWKRRFFWRSSAW
eukprot:CAMPEP_0178381294 /NCGR_PEP_ID=MMETSP0689_2-20121128/5906_1 /TAXON_ID=160604 /ORGANISM="Amphidinium massartii, Strain CS-259" /LENGTH=893 /DNA_ID=CAMNT_0020001467 /DNA_START=55 /DNA_END=2733 /DNA_ORIENTATION=+